VQYDALMSYFTRLYKNRQGIMFDISKPIASHILVRLIPFLSKNNQYHGSQQELAEQVGVSKRNLAVGMQELYRVGVIRKVHRMAYMVSPDIVCEGDDKTQAVTRYLWDQLDNSDMSPAQPH
jgi:predicted transcriptional regulator